MYSLRALNSQSTEEEVNKLVNATHNMLDAMGLFQHHDAITGTEAEHVAQDYGHQLNKAS